MFTRKIHLSWKSGLLAAALLLALTPAAALALDVAQGVLLEVLESPPAHAAPGGLNIPGTFPVGMAGRLAQATLRGEVDGFGTLAFLSGQAELHAQSRVPIVSASGDLGKGPFTGVFQIQNGSKGIVVGKLDGELDFGPTNSGATGCPVLGGPCPFVDVSGMWSTLGKNRTSGAISGRAFIPFQFSGVWYYFDPTGLLGGGFVPLGSDDFSKQFGTPLAKFVITLTP